MALSPVSIPPYDYEAVKSYQSTPAQRDTIKAKAVIFINSKPGALSSGQNGSHKCLDGIVHDDGLKRSNLKLILLNSVMDFRTKAMHDTAQIYTFVLGLPQVSAGDAGFLEWWRVKRQDESGTKEESEELLGRWERVRNLMYEVGLMKCLPCLDPEGRWYSKPEEYLCILLAESELSEMEIRERLGELRTKIVRMRDLHAKFIIEDEEMEDV